MSRFRAPPFRGEGVRFGERGLLRAMRPGDCESRLKARKGWGALPLGTSGEGLGAKDIKYGGKRRMALAGKPDEVSFHGRSPFLGAGVRKRAEVKR